MISVPKRLDERVGEAEHQEVLHRFLAEVVVDAEDLLLVEVPVQNLIEQSGTLQVFSEWLLHDNAMQAARAVQSCGCEVVGYRSEIGRFDGEIENDVRAHTGLGFA